MDWARHSRNAVAYRIRVGTCRERGGHFVTRCAVPAAVAHYPTGPKNDPEQTAAVAAVPANLLESDKLHPATAEGLLGLQQIFGDVWEWTSSGYTGYPGYKPLPGALGEYNGKFMSSQVILRGGSCVTPATHIRATYRNFFSPSTRWQFTGLRLARDI